MNEQVPSLPLPSNAGLRLFEWDLTDEEIQKLLEGGRIRVWVKTEPGMVMPSMAVQVTDAPLPMKES